MIWPNESATQAFAKKLAQAAKLQNALITLRGNLGSGKTTLVRHLLRSLGVQGPIKSPTYALLESYELPSSAVWHFDFYRISDPQEWEDAGLRDIFAGPGLKLVEWPEKVPFVASQADLDIHIVADTETSRQITLSARTATGAELILEITDFQAQE